MSTPSDSEIIPMPGFDPEVFWAKHKNKIIAYGSLLLIAIVAYAAYWVTAQNKINDSRDALSKAGSEEDYSQLIAKFPGTVAAGDASLLLAEKQRDAKKYDQAVATLKAVIDGNPKYPMIDGAWLSLGCTYQAEGKNDEALDIYRQISAKFASRYSAPQAMLAEAEILQAKGNIDEAKRAFENVKTNYPGSYFTAVAMQKLQLLQK